MEIPPEKMNSSLDATHVEALRTFVERLRPQKKTLRLN